MGRRLFLFSSSIELRAAFPDGPPEGLNVGIAGVGLIDAAYMTATAIEADRPDSIVYFGTCGVFRNRAIDVGDVVIATDVRIATGDAVDGASRIPELIPDSLRCDDHLSYEMVRDLRGEGRVRRELHRASVVCTLGITEDNRLAEKIGRRGDVENMELYAILRAAGSIPVSGVLGVTNIVGEGGGEGWRTNYRSIMQEIGSWIR